MGWLFGAKKVPRVPLPQGYKLDEGALRFPAMSGPQQRVIQSDQIKQAVGFEKPFSFPEDAEEGQSEQTMPTYSDQPKGTSTSMAPAPVNQNSNPLYVKVEVYQQILGQLDGLRGDLNHLTDSNRQLESSEYNEQNNFDRLRRAVKSMHDRLLQIDKELFNSQGD